MNNLIALADCRVEKEQFQYCLVGQSKNNNAKRFYQKLRSLKFQVISHNGVFAQCKSSDGQYWQWVPCDRLQHQDGSYLSNPRVLHFSKAAIAKTLAMSTGYDGAALESIDQLDMFE